jgi:hypothetical protein
MGEIALFHHALHEDRTHHTAPANQTNSLHFHLPQKINP